MFPRPQAALLAVLAFSSIAQASWFDDQVNIIRRQDVVDPSPSISTPSGTASSTATDSSETVESTSSLTTSTIPTSFTSTASETTSETLPPTSSISSITSTSSEPSSTSSTTTSSEEESSTTSTVPSSSTKPPRQTVFTTPTHTVIRVTLTTTVDGKIQTTVSETTSSMIATQTRDASNQGSESSGGGMSSGTRNTIIGVVVGIGGAILLGGLAIVAWRIWGRRKTADENDTFSGYRPDTAGYDKSGVSSSAGSNPFQSTLESYHAPTKPVNASSNF